MRALAVICLLASMAFAWVGFQKLTYVPTEMEMASEAVADRDWQQAMRLAQRILQDDNDEAERWQAWAMLVQSAAMLEENSWTINYLEAMLQEYKDEEDRLAWIYRRLGEQYETVHAWDKASRAWLRLLDVEELNPDGVADLYRRMGMNHYQGQDFPMAEDMFAACLAQEAGQNVTGLCRYYLAETLSAENRLDDSLAQIDAALPLLAPGMQGQALFLKGDIFDLQNKSAEAREVFRQALPLHPNPAVVQARLNPAPQPQTLKAR